VYVGRTRLGRASQCGPCRECLVITAVCCVYWQDSFGKGQSVQAVQGVFSYNCSVLCMLAGLVWEGPVSAGHAGSV